jgi:thiosulfate/3-mercaptopyruvate sulfurtransferase
MKRSLLFLVFAFGSLQVSIAQDAPILVTPQWLNEHLHDSKIVILQVSFLKLVYDQEHIEGARYLWPAWIAPDSPEGSLNAPDPKQAKDVLETLGISNNSHVVLCHSQNDVSVTARMFLTLEYLGLRGKVSFLNGGVEAWKKAGFPTTTATTSVKKGKFIPHIDPVLVDRNYVQQHLTSDSVVIVDARMKRFYDGEPTGNPRDGHIAGAKNIPYTDLIDQANLNLFKPVDQLQAYFTPVSNSKGKELVTYCFIGQTASVVYVAGRMLGYSMKLYDGSMQEWSRIKELPMELTPTEKK